MAYWPKPPVRAKLLYLYIYILFLQGQGVSSCSGAERQEYHLTNAYRAVTGRYGEVFHQGCASQCFARGEWIPTGYAIKIY